MNVVVLLDMNPSSQSNTWEWDKVDVYEFHSDQSDDDGSSYCELITSDEEFAKSYL